MKGAGGRRRRVRQRLSVAHPRAGAKNRWSDAIDGWMANRDEERGSSLRDQPKGGREAPHFKNCHHGPFSLVELDSCAMAASRPSMGKEGWAKHRAEEQCQIGGHNPHTSHLNFLRSLPSFRACPQCGAHYQCEIADSGRAILG